MTHINEAEIRARIDLVSNHHPADTENADDWIVSARELAEDCQRLLDERRGTGFEKTFDTSNDAFSPVVKNADT